MKTIKPHSPTTWGIYTERKACLGEIECNKALAERIQDGLMKNEFNNIKRSVKK